MLKADRSFPRQEEERRKEKKKRKKRKKEKKEKKKQRRQEKRERKRRKKEKKARKEKKEKEPADDDEKRYSKKEVMEMFGNFLEEKGVTLSPLSPPMISAYPVSVDGRPDTRPI